MLKWRVTWSSLYSWVRVMILYLLPNLFWNFEELYTQVANAHFHLDIWLISLFQFNQDGIYYLLSSYQYISSLDLAISSQHSKQSCCSLCSLPTLTWNSKFCRYIIPFLLPPYSCRSVLLYTWPLIIPPFTSLPSHLSHKLLQTQFSSISLCLSPLF